MRTSSSSRFTGAAANQITGVAKRAASKKKPRCFELESRTKVDETRLSSNRLGRKRHRHWFIRSSPIHPAPSHALTFFGAALSHVFWVKIPLRYLPWVGKWLYRLGRARLGLILYFGSSHPASLFRCWHQRIMGDGDPPQGRMDEMLVFFFLRALLRI